MRLAFENYLTNHHPDTLLKQPINEDKFLCYLPRHGTIQISGTDKTPFLQNLLTNDITLLNDDECQYSCLCNAKGRVIANFHIIKQDSNYLLILPKSMLEIVIKKLTMYRLRSHIEITATSHILFGQSNPDNLRPFKIPNSNLSYILQPQEMAINRWENLIQDLPACSAYHWQLQLISHSISEIIPETSEHFLPQHLNIDLINGISFNKGCYPGQEIVARLHYLGKTKQRSLTYTLNLNTTPNPGDKIFSADNTYIGNIVNAIASDSKTVHTLITLKLNKLSDKYKIQDTLVFATQTKSPINNQILAQLQ